MASEIDQLVFKFSVNSPLFLEHPLLLNWGFSTTALVTALDLSTNERLTRSLKQRGMTLREHLHQCGFNPNVKIMADTGIFQLEARKAENGIYETDDPMLHFSAEEILENYQLIDPDFVVAPDEIIYWNESIRRAEGKIEQNIRNLERTLDLFPRDKVIAGIQGTNTHQVRTATNAIAELKVTKAARGGLIPLIRSNQSLYREMLHLSEHLARKAGVEHLHYFGLPNIRTLKDCFIDNSYDSLDTSVLYHKTAQRKYLVDKGFYKSVRGAWLERCNCPGCQLMLSKRHRTGSLDFVIGLFVHNCLALRQVLGGLFEDKHLFARLPYFTRGKELVPTYNEQFSPSQGFTSALAMFSDTQPTYDTLSPLKSSTDEPRREKLHFRR